MHIIIKATLQLSEKLTKHRYRTCLDCCKTTENMLLLLWVLFDLKNLLHGYNHY